MRRSVVNYKIGTILVFFLFFGTFLISAAMAEPIVLRMSFYQPPSHVMFKLAEKDFSQVKKLTQGRVEFQLFHSSTLCKAKQMYDYVNSGSAFAAFPTNAYFTKTFPIFQVDTLGVYSRGVQGMYAAYRGGLDELIRDYLREKGLLNLVYAGSTSFSGRSFGSNIPINIPNDFKGLKVRALGNEKSFVKKGGGASVSFPASQVYEGLQRGIVDAVSGQESNWIDWTWYEQVKYIKFVDLTAAPMAVIYNKPILEKLAQEDQKIVKDVISQFLEHMYIDLIKHDKEGRDFLLNQWKGHASYLTKEEQEEWHKVAKLLQEDFVKEQGSFGRKALEIIRRFNPVR